MFSEVYKAGIGSSGIVKDDAVLICLPVLHPGHLAGVTGRQSSIFKTDQAAPNPFTKALDLTFRSRIVSSGYSDQAM